MNTVSVSKIAVSLLVAFFEGATSETAKQSIKKLFNFLQGKIAQDKAGSASLQNLQSRPSDTQAQREFLKALDVLIERDDLFLQELVTMLKQIMEKSTEKDSSLFENKISSVGTILQAKNIFGDITLE